MFWTFLCGFIGIDYLFEVQMVLGSLNGYFGCRYEFQTRICLGIRVAGEVKDVNCYTSNSMICF